MVIDEHRLEDGSTRPKADIDGHNAVREVMDLAKLTVSNQIGRELLFSQQLKDRLHLACRARILAHGSEEALAMMVAALQSQLEQRRRYNESEAERRLQERLPDQVVAGRTTAADAEGIQLRWQQQADGHDDPGRYLGGITLGAPLQESDPSQN